MRDEIFFLRNMAETHEIRFYLATLQWISPKTVEITSTGNIKVVWDFSMLLFIEINDKIKSRAVG